MNTALNPQYFPFVFPVFFVALWMAVTTLIAVWSGWFRLARRFPDRREQPFISLRWQSGWMRGGVNLNGVLNLASCPSGLRIGIMRVFGPFSRPFLVPWDEITVTRSTRWWMPVAKLYLGKPSIGTLIISSHLANRLARAAEGRWPEATLPPRAQPAAVISRLLLGWLLMTGLAAGFFIVVSRSAGGPDALPIAALVLLPAIVIGLNAVFYYFRHMR